jgi:hypothetical protein
MKDALRIGLKAAIRTFAQSMAGALSGVAILGIAQSDLVSAGTAIVVGCLGAVIAAVVAFLQNFAENVK